MGYVFVCPQDMHIVFYSWFHFALPLHLFQPWRLAFLALVWAIWIMCNKVIFRQASFDANACFELFSNITSLDDQRMLGAPLYLPFKTSPIIQKMLLPLTGPYPQGLMLCGLCQPLISSKLMLMTLFFSTSNCSDIGDFFRNHNGRIILHFESRSQLTLQFRQRS